MGLGEYPDYQEHENYSFFGSSQVVETLTILARVRQQALVSPVPEVKALELPISEIIVELDRRMRAIATQTALTADKLARDHLSHNQRRPDTSKGVHLRDCIKSRPGPLGSVHVFLINELNRAINEGSDRSYWQVIEEGSAEIYPDFLGRVLQGVFTGPSHRDSPRAEFGGASNPPGSSFEFMDPLIEGGRGVVSHEIEPVHYLKTGEAAAWAYYVREVSTASSRAAKLLNELAF